MEVLLTPDEDVVLRVDKTFPSDKEAVCNFVQEIDPTLTAAGLSTADVFRVKLVLEEILVNAVIHGNWEDREEPEPEHRNRPVKLRIVMWKKPHAQGMRSLYISVQDQGKGFELERVPDPTDPENLERPCGRGILLGTTFMNEMRVLRIHDDTETLVVLLKSFKCCMNTVLEK